PEPARERVLSPALDCRSFRYVLQDAGLAHNYAFALIEPSLDGILVEVRAGLLGDARHHVFDQFSQSHRQSPPNTPGGFGTRRQKIDAISSGHRRIRRTFGFTTKGDCAILRIRTSICRGASNTASIPPRTTPGATRSIFTSACTMPGATSPTTLSPITMPGARSSFSIGPGGLSH